ncbi:hypothetical protein OKW96_14920 [Sphingobacterium sp. KU25419]|nr:hypothetical protein OKW96_14920 [Sphingobacterium sp. KU25419]
MIEVKLDLKPVPVPLAYQPIYKIIILLSILRYGCPRPYNATFLKIHLYFWALRDEGNYIVMKQISCKERDSLIPWSFEPSLERIVTLAVINKFCTRKILSGNLQIQLLDAGIDLLKKLKKGSILKMILVKLSQLEILLKQKLRNSIKIG